MKLQHGGLQLTIRKLFSVWFNSKTQIPMKCPGSIWHLQQRLQICSMLLQEVVGKLFFGKTIPGGLALREVEQRIKSLRNGVFLLKDWNSYLTILVSKGR